MDAIRFGRGIRALRRRQLLRQVDLGDRARVSQSLVSRIELGKVGRIPFARIHAVGAALGVEVGLDVQWQGERFDRLLDEAHASTVDAAARLLRRLGWEVLVEASFSIDGERGSIDILARHAESSVVLVIEVKSVVPDAQATIFGLDRKGRLGPAIAAQRGWTCRGAARMLFVSESRTSRRRTARYAAMFEAAFPLQGAAARAWLRRPSAEPIAGLLFISASSLTRGVSVGPGPRGRQRVVRARDAGNPPARAPTVRGCRNRPDQHAPGG